MDKKKIIRRLCKAIIGYSGNTSNLTYHLQRPHSQELVKLREDNGDKPGPSSSSTVKQPSSKQQSLLGIVERSILFPQDSAKHKRLVSATADFICQGLLPLRVVDESSFGHLLEIAEPDSSYRIERTSPTRSYLQSTTLFELTLRSSWQQWRSAPWPRICGWHNTNSVPTFHSLSTSWPSYSCITVVVPLLLHCNFTFDPHILYCDVIYRDMKDCDMWHIFISWQH